MIERVTGRLIARILKIEKIVIRNITAMVFNTEHTIEDIIQSSTTKCFKIYEALKLLFIKR